MTTSFPAAYAGFPRKAGGTCAFDQPAIDGDSKFFSGWGFISATDSALAEAMLVGISSGGTEKFAVLTKTKREDVAKYFKNPAVMDSGFSIYVSKADIPHGSKATVYQIFQGIAYVCENTITIN